MAKTAPELATITVVSKTNSYYSIGMEFSQRPKMLKIASKPEEVNAAQGVISESQATELRADQFITVIQGQGVEVASEQAQALYAANAELEVLRLENAALKATIAELQAAAPK